MRKSLLQIMIGILDKFIHGGKNTSGPVDADSTNVSTLWRR